MAFIELSGMEFYAYHGCYEEEKIIGNKFVVSFGYYYDITKSAASDNLADAINYQSIYSIIDEEIRKPSHLLENLATRIIDRVLKSYPIINKAVIKVMKVNPSLGGVTNNVSITIEKNNSFWTF